MTNIYAWFSPSTGGHIIVGRSPDHTNLEFNKSAVHFWATASPASHEIMKQLTAIAQIGIAVAGDAALRQRCMEDITVLQEIHTLVPIVLTQKN